MRKSHSVNNGNLFLRCNDICKSHGLSLSRYLFDEQYVKRCKKLLYSETCDGVADTICTLFTNYNYNSKMLIKQLLIGYEPAGLTVHPPRMIEGGFIFFAWMSSATKKFS